jgi:hypothetical protein
MITEFMIGLDFLLSELEFLQCVVRSVNQHSLYVRSVATLHISFR